MHIDLDAFFASVEILDNPKLRSVPLIIGTKGERSVVSTASYEARKYGVHSAMPMKSALRLCPNATVIKPRMKRYHEKSNEVMAIISSFAPGFQQASIDEAFLDFSGMERLYPLPGKAAKGLKERIKSECGITCSIGVAQSKFIAKMASDYHKPDGLTIVPPNREEEFVDKVGLFRLWGVGKSMQEALKSHSINSVETLRKYPQKTLEGFFGKSAAAYLYNASRGIDPGAFQEAKTHSISAERTFRYDIYDWETLEYFLLELSEEIFYKSLDEHMVARTVGIKIRYGDFSTYTFQETPKDQGIYSSDDVYRLAKRLLKRKDIYRGVRLIGVFISSLYRGDEIEQRDLFSEDKEKRRRLEKEILNLSKKGDYVMRARRLDKKP